MNKMNTTFRASIILILILSCLPEKSLAQVFWSEDFTNGIPSDWGNVDLLSNNGEWTWCDDPTETSGGGCPGITVGQEAFMATTAETGFVTVASDEIGTTGNTHISELTTSSINCTTYDEVYLTFETTIGIYEFPADDNVFLQVSTDNNIWEDFPIFPTLVGTGSWSANPEEINFNLTDIAAGESSVYLRWRWVAGWEYYWNLDDIQLHASNPSPPNDMQVNTNWFATALNSMVPASQVETFGFMADVENVGSTDVTNVLLNARIANIDSLGTALYDVSLEFGDMQQGDLIQNLLFPDAGFLADPVPASYVGTYTVLSDSVDTNPTNNKISFGFEVTDSTFAKDSGLSNATGGAPPTSVWEPGEFYAWAYGNHFYVPNGGGMYATKASFAIANANDPGIPGKQLNVRLYKWNNDTDNEEFMDPQEREWIGSAIYTIAGDETSSDLITVPIYTPVNNNPILLEDDTEYVLMLEHAATDQRIIAFMITQDTDYTPAIYRSLELGSPRYAGMLAYGDPLSSESFSSFGFGRDVVPVLRLHISEYPFFVGVEDALSSDNKVTVYPNPADDFIHVAIDLVEQHETVKTEIFDQNGKLLKHRNLGQLEDAQLKFDLEGLAAGSYFLNLSSAKGQRTVGFSVVR